MNKEIGLKEFTNLRDTLTNLMRDIKSKKLDQIMANIIFLDIFTVNTGVEWRSEYNKLSDPKGYKYDVIMDKKTKKIKKFVNKRPLKSK